MTKHVTATTKLHTTSLPVCGADGGHDVEALCSAIMMCGRTLCHPHGLRLVDVIPTCNTCGRSMVVDDETRRTNWQACCSSQHGAWLGMCSSNIEENNRQSVLRHRLLMNSNRIEWYCAFGQESRLEVDGRAIGCSCSAADFVSPLKLTPHCCDDTTVMENFAFEAEHALSRVEESCWGDVWWRALEAFAGAATSKSSFTLHGQRVLCMYSLLVWVRRPVQCVELRAHEWNGPLLPPSVATAASDDRVLQRALVVDVGDDKEIERWYIDMTSARLDVQHQPGKPLCTRLEHRPRCDDDFAVHKWAPPSVRALQVCSIGPLVPIGLTTQSAVQATDINTIPPTDEATRDGTQHTVTPNLDLVQLEAMARPIYRWVAFLAQFPSHTEPLLLEKQ